jgi:hypothetical protein
MGTILRLSEDLWRSFRGVLQEVNPVFAAIFVEGKSFPFAHVYSDATEYMYGGINCKKRNEAEGNTKRHSESVQ